MFFDDIECLLNDNCLSYVLFILFECLYSLQLLKYKLYTDSFYYSAIICFTEKKVT